jgi:hypothetical protein
MKTGDIIVRTWQASKAIGAEYKPNRYYLLGLVWLNRN